MARFLVEILINAAGGPKARASFDDVGASAASAAKRVEQAGIQSERALRRTAEAAERLKDQMEDTKASKGLIADLQAMNRRTQEQVTAFRGGATALERYQQKELEAAQGARILAAQVKAGVSATSEHGRAIASLIREHDRLQAELHQTQAAQSSTNRIGIDFSSVAAGMISSVAGIVAGFAGLQAIRSYLTSAVGAIVEAEDATGQLEARIRSFGTVGGLGLGALITEANSLSHELGIDDEAVIQLQSTLARFDAIDTPALFKRTTRSAIDLAAATTEAGQSIESNFSAIAETLGKFAVEPDEALAQLEKRVGRFTDAEEKLILQTAKAGDEAGALTLALDILDQRVGGTALSLRDTLGGSLRAVGVEWENQKELLAEGISPALRQIAEDFSAWSQREENVRRMTELGHDLARVLESVADATGAAARGLDSIDASGLAPVISGLVDLFGWVAAIPEKFGSWAPAIEAAFGPLQTYNRLAIGWLSDLIHMIDGIPEKLSGISAGLDPRRAAGAGAGIALPSGLTPTQLKQWEEAEREVETVRRQSIKTSQARTASSDREKKSTVDLATAARKLMADLDASVKAARESAGAAGESETAYKKVKLAQEQAAKTEQIRTAYIKAGIPWTEKQTAAVYAGVKALRDLKTQEDAALKSRALILKVTIDTSSLDRAIEDASKKSVDIDLEWRRSAFEINQQNQQAFSDQRAQVQSQLEEQADYFRSTLITPKEELDALMRHIDALAHSADEAGRPLLSAAEAERLRTQAAQDYYSSILNDTASFFGQLADMFGGFFDYLAQAADTLQRAQQTQQSWSSMASSMGASSGTASAAGGVGAFVVVAQAMYDYYKSAAAEREKRRYDHAGLTARSDGQWFNDTSGLLSSTQREFGLRLQSMAQEFASLIGGSLDTLASLEVTVRRDGKYFEAWVQGEIIGRFESMEEAVQAAILGAFQSSLTTIRGLDPLVQEGLNKVRSTELDDTSLKEAQDFLSKLNEISEIGFPPLVTQLREGLVHINSLREALAQLDPTSEAVIDATKRLDQAQRDLFESARNQALGIDASMAQAVRALGGLRQGLSEIAQGMQEEIQARLDKAERALAKLGTEPEKTPGGGEGPSSLSQAEWEKETVRLKAAIDRYKEELSEIPKALSEQEIDMGITSALESQLRKHAKYAGMLAELERYRVTKQFESLRLELVAIGAWERWAGMWQDLYNQALQDAGKPIGGSGRGGGGGDRDSVRDFIKDKGFELSLHGLTEYQRGLKEIDRLYTEQLKKAGNDKKLRQELLALKEQELAQLRAEQARSTADKFKDFLGLATPFDAVRKTAADLIKEIEGSPFGDERKARMIGRVMEELDKKLDELAQKSTLSLFGEMVADLEKFGVGEETRAQMRKQMAIIEHQLKLSHYRIEIEILRASGKVGAATLALLDNGLRLLEGIDPTTLLPANDNVNPFGPRRFSSRDPNQVAEELANATKRAFDLLRQYQEAGLSPLARELKKINEDFLEIAKTLGSTPEVLRTREDAIQRAIMNAMSGVKQAYDSLLKGPGSGLTPQAQYQQAEADYARLLAQVRGGDFGNLDEFSSVIQRLSELGIERYGSSTGGYQDLRTRLLAELGPLASGTGLNLSQLLSGSTPASMVPALTANNDTNTRLMISAYNDNTVQLRTSMERIGDRQFTLLSTIADRLSGSGTGLKYGT